MKRDAVGIRVIVGLPPFLVAHQDARATFDLPVVTKDALASKHGEYDLVLANPPFGKKSSVTITSEEGEVSKESLVINRDDFWAGTSNKFATIEGDLKQ